MSNATWDRSRGMLQNPNGFPLLREVCTPCWGGWLHPGGVFPGLQSLSREWKSWPHQVGLKPPFPVGSPSVFPVLSWMAGDISELDGLFCAASSLKISTISPTPWDMYQKWFWEVALKQHKPHASFSRSDGVSHRSFSPKNYSSLRTDIGDRGIG